MAALVFWTLAVFLGLALASYRDVGGEHWVGPVGEVAARGLVSVVGVVAWVLPVELLLLGIPFVLGRRSSVTPARVAGDLLLSVIAAALVQVAWPKSTAFGSHAASGLVGELFGELARSLFSTVGSFLVGFALLGLVLIGRASFSFIALMRMFGVVGKQSAVGTASAAKSVADAWRTARDLERDEREALRIRELPNIDLTPHDHATVVAPVLPDSEGDVDPAPDSSAGRPRRARRKKPAITVSKEIPELDAVADDGEDEAEDEATEAEEAEAGAAPKPRRRSRAKAKVETDADDPDTEAVEPSPPPVVTAEEVAALSSTPSAGAVTKKSRRGKAKEDDGPTIIDTTKALETESAEAKRGRAKAERAKSEKPTANDGVRGFKLPPVDFLVPAKVDPTILLDKEQLFKNAELLVKTLADYRVQGKVEDILPGPTVTTYEVSPAAGTKVSKVASLADDLALALARKVRIVAPIPGKNRIGFELPNERRVPVNLRDLVEDRRFQSLDVPLPVVLGRDILGNPVYADLASMPHVIVAGATGAGKSVGLNVMLTSLLYRRTPDELRLLMIDPKVVELAPFDRIPHMLLPVVTDMKQAATALKWAVDEMERRYQLFADAGTKNIGTFNAWVARVRAGEAKNPLPRTVVAKDHNGLPEEIRPGEGEEGEQQFPESLPLIVIVVDEFADLMIQQGKEVEVAVARLAQKARAAGMHVILATQRPSVDVITGMIKANFPTRIAYRVAQKVDSRTILDEQGAEHLLGRGDMLIKLNGTNETKRVQCPWVSEEEVNLVTDSLRAQGEPVYDENILKPRDEDGEQAAEEDGEQDAMYDDAVRIVAETRRCSTSWLQRKLGLGYNRAARIVETMERRGLVGPANGAKDREVLIQPL
ncbi:MAG: DNA translocase FtsK 4TM domain-containing protein [Polyangiaceae bacterium]